MSHFSTVWKKWDTLWSRTVYVTKNRNIGEKCKFLVENLNFIQKSRHEIRATNANFCRNFILTHERISILVENSNFGRNLQLWLKLEIIVQIGNYRSNWNTSSKLEIFIEIDNFSSKVVIFVKMWNFRQNWKFSSKLEKISCQWLTEIFTSCDLQNKMSRWLIVW
mgnify:CR=1 FL=1